MLVLGLLHLGQARADEPVHVLRAPRHVLLGPLKARLDVCVRLAALERGALLELDHVHHVLALPGLAVLVLEKGALLEITQEVLQLELEHAGHEVGPVVVRLPGLQRPL